MKVTRRVRTKVPVARAKKDYPAEEHDGWTRPAHRSILTVCQLHDVEFELEIDLDQLSYMGARAAENKSGRATLASGAIRARVIKKTPLEELKVPEGFEIVDRGK